MKKTLQFNLRFITLLFFILFVCGNMTYGAARIASVSGNWSDPATWGGDAAPTSTDDVTVNAGVVVTMDVNGTCGTITDMTGGSFAGPGDLRITGNAGVAIANISGIAFITCSLILPDDASINVNGTLTISGVISGAAFNLIKNGVGKLILSGANQYDGLTTVNSGILNLQDDLGAGSAINGIVVNDPGQLELESTIMMLINESLSLSGTGVSGGALYNVSGTNVWFGPIAIDGIDTRIGSAAGNLLLSNTMDLKNNILTFQGASNTFVSGVVSNSGTGSILKEGTGNLSFGAMVVSVSSLGINSGKIFSTADNFNLTGDFTNNGIFDPNGGTVNFNGSTIQNIGGTQTTSFNNLTINNPSGVLLGSSEIVDGVLTLTSGILPLGSYNLTLSAFPVAGSPSVSNMIVTDGIGECRRVFTSNDSYVFPVGDATGIPEYSPITLNFTSGNYTAGAYAGIRVIDGIQPDNASATDYLTRYWAVSVTGISSYTYDVSGTFTNSSDDITGIIANIITGLWTGSLWQNYNPVIAPIISATGVTSTGDFTGISLTTSTLPNITLGANPSICSGSVLADLPYTSTINSPDQYSIVWDAAALGAGFTDVTLSTLPASPISIDVPAGAGANIYTGTIIVHNSITGDNSSGTIFTVTINPELTVTTDNQTNINCFGNTTGAINMSVTGGTPVYSYSWTKNGSAFAPITEDLTGLKAGVYIVTVNDGSGCSISQTVTITQPDSLSVILTATNATCFGGNKSISAAISGSPLSDLEINIDGGAFALVSSSPVVFNSLTTASHTIILRRISDTNCLVTESASVTEPTALGLVLTATNATCFGGNKSISAAISGSPLSDLEINIDGGAFAPIISSPVVFNSLTAGNHIIILRRISDITCLVTKIANVTEPQVLTAGSIAADQLICYNDIPTGFTELTHAMGGDGTYTYQWQSSLTGGAPWSDISGANSSTYSPGLLTATTWYQRAVTSGSCGTAYSTGIKITVNNLLNAGSIGSDQSVCYNSLPNPFTNELTPSGGSTLIYQWQQKVGAGSWTNISGATSLIYSVTSNLTQTTLYRRSTTYQSGCGTVYSNEITVTVFPDITAGTIGAAQSICSNSKPTSLTELIPATGGTGSYTYQWQSSANNLTWTNIVDSTSASYSPGVLLSNTYYRRVVTSGSCTKAYSFSILIAVLPDLTAPVASGNRTICYNTAPAALSASAASGGSGTFTYQWQVSTNNILWTNISGANNYSSYSPPALTGTNYYRLIATSTGLPGCGTVKSNVITITVLPELLSPVVSADQIICYSKAPLQLTATPASGGTEAFVYQWFSSLNNISWSYISGANGLTYQPPALTTSTYYHVLATPTGVPSCSSKQSNSILITVNPKLITGTIGSSQTICYNTVPARLTELTPATGGMGSYTYQWQISSNNFTWTDIVDSTSATYSPEALIATTYYRRVVTSGSCGTAEGFSIAITVYPKLNSPIVSSNRTICYNTVPAALSASSASGGSGIFTYQWQSSQDNSVWTNIIGATNYSTYSPPALTGTSYYRLLATSTGIPACEMLTSNVVTISVLPELISPVVSSDQNICYNDAPLQLSSTQASGGNNTFTYQWFSSLDNSSWTYISGATALTYQPSALAASTYYRIIATSTGVPACSGKISNSVLITVKPNLTSGTIGTAQTICYNTIPSGLTEVSPATGGTGSYTYQWQSSPNNFSWTNIVDSTSATYSPGALLSSIYYRRVVSSGSCGTIPGFGILVTVRPKITASTASGSQTICYNKAPGTITATAASGGSGTFTYQWQLSQDTIIWTNIPGAINYSSYSPPALTSTSYYRLVVTSTGTPSCGLLKSNIVTITVLPDMIAPVASSDQTICYGTTPLLLTSTPASGGNETFTYQWYSSLNNISWSFISGATGLTYQPSSLTTSTYFQVIATATGVTACGNQPSNAVLITVNPIVTSGTIGTAQAICYNSIPASLTELTSPAGGTGSYTYQWQSSVNNFTWTNIPDSISATYSPGALLSNTYYRRVVSSGSCNKAFSFGILITVRPDLTAPVASGNRTICYNTSPGLLTASVATGGSGSFTYQWQSSQDTLLWTNIPGATSYNIYSPPILTNTSYYRLVATATGTPLCGAKPSNVVTITVLPDLVAPVVTADQIICYNSAPLQLTSTVASGGNNSFSYQWYSSLNNISWSLISGATGLTYQPASLTATTYYHVIATATGTPACGFKISNSAIITVYSNPGVIATPASQIICSGNAPNIVLSGTVAGTTFDWTVVESGVSGASAGSGVNISQALTLTGATAGTATYTITPKANGCVGTSKIVVISINPIPQVTATPVSPTICSATTTSISLSSNISSTTFAWTVVQSGVSGAYAGNGTTIAQTLYTTGPAAGTASYTITPTLNSCVGVPVVVVITVNPSPVATANPTSQAVCSGMAPSIALTSNIAGSTFSWTVIQSGATGAFAGSGSLIDQPLTATGITAGTVIYTILPTANSCTGAVKTAVITVRPKPVATASPTSQAICSGTTTSIAFTSNISGTTYNWTPTVNPSGSISGAAAGSGTSIAQTLSNSTLATATVNYNIIPSSGSCTGDPLDVEITVNPVSTLSSPLTALVCSNTLFNYIPTSATSSTTFSWTRSVVLGIQNGASAGNGAINETLVNTTGISKTVIYAYALKSFGCTTVQNVSVTVNPAPILLSSLSPPAICSNSPFNYTPITSIAGTTITWTRAIVAGISNPAGSGTGSISETLINTTASDVVVSYLYSLTLSGCTSTYTVNLTIKPTPTVNLPADMEFCNGSSVPAIVFTGSVTGTSYTWGNNNTGIGLGASGVGNISSFTALNNTSALLTALISVRPTANGCSGANSTFNISVYPSSKGGIINSDALVCSGANNGTLTLTGYVGTIVKWQFSTDAGGNWTDISNFTSSQSYTNLSLTTQYRAVVQSSTCAPAFSSIATITVNQASFGGTVAADAIVCYGSNNGTLTLSGQNGTIVKWQSSINNGTSWSDINNTSLTQIFSNLTSTTLYRSVVQNGVCSVANSATATITVNPASVGGIVSGGTTVCSGTNNSILTLSGYTGSITKWQSSALADFSSGVTDIVNTTSSLTVNNLVSTTYYRAVVTSGVCSTVFSSQAAITVNPLPVAIAGGSQTICSSGTVTVIGASSANGTILWSENGVGSISSGATTLTPTYTAAAGDAGNSVILTMTVTSNNVCAPQTATATYTVIVNRSPIAIAGGSQTICSNGTATISGASAANGTILWTENGAGSITSGANTLSPVYTAAAADAGTTVTLTMTVTSNNACSPQTATATYTIVITPLPTATAGGSQTICSSGAATVSGASATNGTILWTENGAGSITAGATTLTPTYTPTAADAGNIVTLTMTVTSSNSCAPQTATATYSMIVNPASIGGAVSVGSTVCSGTNSTILTLNGYSGNIIKWQSSTVAGFGSGVTDIANTSNSLTASNLSTTTYYRAVVQNGTCPVAYSSAATINVNPTPVLVVTNPVPVCSPGTVNLTTAAVTTGSTPGLTFTYFTDSAATLVYPNPTTAVNDIYYIKGTTAAGCYDVKAVTASVFSTLGIPVFALGATSNICQGAGTVAYTATATNAITLTYSLDAASLSAGNTINSATGMVTYVPGYSGISKITSSATGCGAPATAIHTVTVNSAPTVSLVASPSTAVCEGTGVTLTASNSGGTELKTYSGTSGNIFLTIPDNKNTPYTYSTITLSGSGGANLISTDVLMVTLNINHNADQDLDIFLVDPTGTRAMLLSSDNGGNSPNYSNTVIRTDAVTPITAGAAPFTGTFSPEGSITAAPILSGATGGGNYSSVVPGNALNSTTGAPIDGVWSLRVFDDKNGNAGTLVNWSLAIIRQINPVYSTDVTGPPAIGAVSYSGVNNATATAVVTPPAGSNIYTVTTTGSNGCSTTSNAVTVVVNPLPTPTITADYCTYRPKVRLTTGSYSSYQWNTGATAQYIDVDIAGKYTVSVTSNGCTGTASIQVADELVTNGDFELGEPGRSTFSTDYGFRTATGSLGGGLYGIGKNARPYYTPGFRGAHDHTSGSGYFMIVDGTESSKVVWQQTITVTPNTDYYFAAWGLNIYRTDGKYDPDLQFSVNGSLVGTHVVLNQFTNSDDNPWVSRFWGQWNSGTATTAIVQIRDLQTSPNQNDFGLDDISFGTLANTPFTFTASNNSPMCSRNPLQLSSTVSGGRMPISYSWTGPNGFTSTDANPLINNIAPNAGGTYSLSVVDYYNCPVTPVTTIVTLSPTPEIPNQTSIICSGTTFNATPINGVPDASTFIPAGTTYSWSAPVITPVGSVTGASAQSAQTSISQTLTNTTNLPATVKYFTTTPVNGTCTGNNFTVTVTVNPAVTANAGANQQICTGSTVQLNGSVGGAATSGSWTGGTGSFNPNRNTLNAIYTPSAAERAAGTVSLTLTSNDADGTGPCSAAVSTVIITINALPVLSSSVVNMNCHGASTGSVNLSVSGGSPGYTYLWTSGNGGIIPSGQANIEDLSGLVVGTYTVAVSDAKSCGASLSVTLTEPTALVAHETHTTVPCVIGATTVTITATGGTASYTGTGTFSQFAGTTVYTVTDAKGCTAPVSATVIADPNSAPVITSCPIARNFIGCSTAAIAGPVFSGTPVNSTYAEFSSSNNLGVATDNCAVTTVTYQDVASSGCPIVVTRTWTLGDALGLTTTCNQILSVKDAVAPSWINAAGDLNRSVECSDASGLAAALLLFPTASDDCDPDVSNSIKITGSFVASSGCSQRGTFTNTWRVTDECGNISSAYIQTITITDNTAPTWITAAGALDRTVECSNMAAINAAQVLVPVASDFCDANVTNVVKVAGVFVPGGVCAKAGTYTNTWTVTDDCGNVSAVYTQLITIVDNTAPVWLTAPGEINRTVACDDVSDLINAQALRPVAWDNCATDVSNISKTSGLFVPSSGCQQEGKYTNTWIVTDGCGNTSEVYTQVITIVDNTGPMILCPASNALSCDSPSFEPTATGTAIVIDNCDANPALTWSDAIIPGGCPGNYQIVRTWTATDACGKSNTCNQTVFVQDVTAPVISSPVSGNVSFLPSPSIVYTTPDNALDATATDNCSGVTLSAQLTGATMSGPYASLVGVAFNEGVTTVTWTAIDGCGISSSIQYTVTVTLIPEISCSADIVQNNDFDLCIATINPGFPSKIVGTAPIVYTWVMTGATSGSGIGPIGYYTFNKGVTNITWTATNAAGSDVCTQTITVIDSQPPTFSTPPDLSYCVEYINTAQYYDLTMDITPARPDFYVFKAGNTDLDIDPSTFADNCPISCVFEIRWRIDFEDGTFIPALPDTFISGQPSAYGLDIQFSGNSISNVYHHITYQVVDCNGNISAQQVRRITINPRPNLTKITPP